MDILIDTIKDTIFILPILFIMYFVLEYFEHKNVENDYSHQLYTYGPLFGAIVGIVPQCGFGILASMLFIEGKITLGTLISVFIATSDEAIPILITNPDFYQSMIFILILKLILAVAIGYIVDIIFSKKTTNYIHPRSLHHRHHSLFVEAILRTLKIYLFIFIVNLGLSYIIELIGTEKLSTFLLGHSMLQPIVSGLFGFIPNCAATVVLTQLFMNQTLSFASLMSGLITNAGLGIIVLIQNKVKVSLIIRICVILFISALLIGLPLQWFYLHG